MRIYLIFFIYNFVDTNIFRIFVVQLSAAALKLLGGFMPLCVL